MQIVGLSLSLFVPANKVGFNTHSNLFSGSSLLSCWTPCTCPTAESTPAPPTTPSENTQNPSPSISRSGPMPNPLQKTTFQGTPPPPPPPRITSPGCRRRNLWKMCQKRRKRPWRRLWSRWTLRPTCRVRWAATVSTAGPAPSSPGSGSWAAPAPRDSRAPGANERRPPHFTLRWACRVRCACLGWRIRTTPAELSSWTRGQPGPLYYISRHTHWRKILKDMLFY